MLSEQCISCHSSINRKQLHLLAICCCDDMSVTSSSKCRCAALQTVGLAMLVLASNAVTHITKRHGSAGFPDRAHLHSEDCCSLHCQIHKHRPALQAVTKAATMTLQDLQTLILVNCGATEDVAKLLDLQESVRVVVIDSHRPFHHNLNDDNINILAFCNPADGTCDNVPEPDIFSGTDNVQTQASCSQLLVA